MAWVRIPLLSLFFFTSLLLFFFLVSNHLLGLLHLVFVDFGLRFYVGVLLKAWKRTASLFDCEEARPRALHSKLFHGYTDC
ncbi:hypothetical protein BO83DRAFT_142357 [Aspergillus eucalypticola CBS 122712]|uniref:Uncharacterized protein n=1 Tax=Aspergillus eucalypticola (strain CBS 122712 / IBT 29274) TaxID=1448314 RepID=A0A317UVF1_ASPEC|nr:uncharacterized protein BO83DRAFT_142357 [Aspergillus eucalypticola CBS 122712]PWY64442.1 hypothetical protein BO83DRAFT_142357 [Aspergillus eucalypticola CBS 122712]